MDIIFDSLPLLHSGSVLEALKYLLCLALLIFMSYSGTLLASSFLSLYFRNRARKINNEDYFTLSLHFIDLITPNALMGFGLGVIPLTGIIMIYIQLMQGTKTDVLTYFLVTFILYIWALVLLYIYKHSLHVNILFDKFGGPAEEEEDFETYYSYSRRINIRAIIWGLLLLFLSLWIFISGNTLLLDPGKWSAGGNIFSAMFALPALIKSAHYISISFAISGAAFVVKYFYWDKLSYRHSEAYAELARGTGFRITLIFTAMQPAFIVLNLLITPKPALSSLSLVLVLAAFFLAFILLHVLRSALKEKSYGLATVSFYLILAIFLLGIVNDRSAFGVAAGTQLLTLSEKYDKNEKLLLASAGTGEKISGEALYNTNCTACHKYDVRLVGPPHRDVMKKYADNRESMIKYILNPVKVDPAYPNMPSPGLSPKEAKAIVDYMYTHFTEVK